MKVTRSICDLPDRRTITVIHSGLLPLVLEPDGTRFVISLSLVMWADTWGFILPPSLAEGVFTWVTQWHTWPIRKKRGQGISVGKLGELWRDAAAAECVSVCFVFQSPDFV